MNKLTVEERTRILHSLCEGMSIRAITRQTGASKNTVAKLLIDAGKACTAYHDANVRNLKAARIQVDEVWSFNAGDTWTWTAIDVDTKMIVSYLVGDRDAEYAKWFIDDLAARLANRVHLTSDGHRAYLEAVNGRGGCEMDYSQLIKLYGDVGDKDSKVRNSPAERTGVCKRAAEGHPNADHIWTGHFERHNLTMRMHERRFTGLTTALSKKIERHAYAVALHLMYYNFVRIRKALCITPAMAAGVSDRVWDIMDIAMLVEQAEGKPAKRGPYREQDQITN